MDNAAIARALYDLADVMELGKEAAFKVRAFRSAARSIEGLTENAEDLLHRGTLTDVRGIGAGVARRVAELAETGDLAELCERRKLLPPGLAELTRVAGVGLKTAEVVWRELTVGSVDELEAACRRGAVRALPRFGEKREQKLLDAITAYRARAAAPVRWTQGQARDVAAHLVERMRAVPGVVRVEVAGSLRRGCETIGDVDVLVAAPSSAAPAVMDVFASLPDVAQVLVKGDTKTSVVLRDGLQADLRLVLPECWGAALQYFTGSKEHNVATRTLAVRKGLKVSEYGVFDEHGARVAGAEEADVYEALGLCWVPPELRENRGEVEAALARTLPLPLEAADVRGDLHMHTTESDGRSTLAEMAEAARAAGREYIAITDHSHALALANGLDAERLAEQGRQIRALDESLGGSFRVLRGVEADILADGSVDLGPEVLRDLDWVVASVHSQFGMAREEQTRRVVKALESGVVDCLGHPTGRLLTRRDPYAIDIEAVLAAAKRVGAAVELNASPNRLDLDEHALRLAREMGVMVILSSDAHSTRQLGFIEGGVTVARRAWLERAHVANTLPVGELLERFRHHHAR